MVMLRKNYCGYQYEKLRETAMFLEDLFGNRLVQKELILTSTYRLHGNEIQIPCYKMNRGKQMFTKVNTNVNDKNSTKMSGQFPPDSVYQSFRHRTEKALFR